MDTRYNTICRKMSFVILAFNFYFHSHFSLIKKVFAPNLVINLVLILSASVSGCGPGCEIREPQSEISLKINGKGSSVKDTDSLDVFVFNDDRSRRLDSYQRMASLNSGKVGIASRSGDKIIFVLANSGMARFGWYEVNCYQSLDKIFVRLEDESRDAPSMTAAVAVSATDNEVVGINLKPLCCEVVINSIRCDFSGMPYSGEKIRGAKAFLMNVNAEFPVSGASSGGATRLINSYHLDERDVGWFSDKRLIVQEFSADIGNAPLSDKIALRCFPNCPESETAGSPRTRLVIEGDIEGFTYFWAFPVGEEGEGVERNNRYMYDITINRKGTTSPDQDAEAEDVTIKMTVEQWKEKDNYDVMF